MRPAFSRRARTPLVSLESIQARRGASRTARLVFSSLASRLGQALIDRRLYLPEAWASDDARRSRVQIPASVTFATKPQIACALIGAALDAGVPCGWVLADALYGSDSRLRRMLEERRQPYVLAVRSNHHLRFPTEAGLLQTHP